MAWCFQRFGKRGKNFDNQPSACLVHFFEWRNQQQSSYFFKTLFEPFVFWKKPIYQPRKNQNPDYQPQNELQKGVNECGKFAHCCLTIQVIGFSQKMFDVGVSTRKILCRFIKMQFEPTIIRAKQLQAGAMPVVFDKFGRIVKINLRRKRGYR
jgi:hypothetical protein